MTWLDRRLLLHLGALLNEWCNSYHIYVVIWVMRRSGTDRGLCLTFYVSSFLFDMVFPNTKRRQAEEGGRERGSGSHGAWRCVVVSLCYDGAAVGMVQPSCWKTTSLQYSQNIPKRAHFFHRGISDPFILNIPSWNYSDPWTVVLVPFNTCNIYCWISPQAVRCSCGAVKALLYKDATDSSFRRSLSCSIGTKPVVIQ